MTKFLKPLFIIIFFCSANFATAEQSQDFGQYSVHYITVNSTFIDADIAKQYGINRSKRSAFVNISVLKNLPDGSTLPVTATLSGTKNNLLRQITEIDFIEVREGDAIYYIGQFDFSNAEKLNFEMKIQPEQTGPMHSLKWANTLYSN